MLDMFKLAGYSLNEECEDGKGRPKTVIELLKEALNNPPEDAAQWIRIDDIPRYIKEQLQPWDQDKLNSFNDAVLVKQPTGINAEDARTGHAYVDQVGSVWYKEAANKWSLQDDDDKGGYLDIDANQFGPLNETAKSTDTEGRRITRL